jgi:hypothetical protein
MGSLAKMHFRLRSGSLKEFGEAFLLVASKPSVVKTKAVIVCHRKVRNPPKFFAESGDRSDPANGIRNQHFTKNLAYFLHRPGFQNHGIEAVVGKVRHDRRLGITAGDNQL